MFVFRCLIQTFDYSQNSSNDGWSGFESEFGSEKNNDYQSETISKPKKSSNMKISQNSDDFNSLDVKSKVTKTKKTDKNEEDAWDMLNN